MLLAAGTELAPSAGHDKIWQPGEAAGCMPDGPQLGCHHSAVRGDGGGAHARMRGAGPLCPPTHTRHVYSRTRWQYTRFGNLTICGSKNKHMHMRTRMANVLIKSDAFRPANPTFPNRLLGSWTQGIPSLEPSVK